MQIIDEKRNNETSLSGIFLFSLEIISIVTLANGFIAHS
jgi:hypothetical protein